MNRKDIEGSIGKYIHVEFRDSAKGSNNFYFGKLNNFRFFNRMYEFYFNPFVENEGGKFKLSRLKREVIKFIKPADLLEIRSENCNSVRDFIKEANVTVKRIRDSKSYTPKSSEDLYMTTKMGFKPESNKKIKTLNNKFRLL